MKCTLIVISGAERSQRSCEMTEKFTTRKQIHAFLKSQDLRLEAGDFDYTVNLDGVGDAWPLKTDADARLFLAQAKHLGGKPTFHIRLRGGPSSPSDREGLLSAEYAIDLDIVTLHVYAPSAAAPAPSSASHGRTFQEKMFVVPTRFVLDKLMRAVRDTVSAGMLKANTKLVLYSLRSADDSCGTALMDDAAALSFLHEQAKRRDPARVTYTMEAAQSPFARRNKQPPSQEQPQGQGGETPLVSKASSPSLPPLSADDAAPKACQAPTVDLPPLQKTKEHAPAAAPAKVPNGSCQPVQISSVPMVEVPVEVRMEGCLDARTLTFTYSRREMQLYQRFHDECGALFAAAAGTSVLTLSSDPSVVIDGDGVLRELLALSREAQQPLRARLRILSQPKQQLSRANSNKGVLPPRAAPMENVLDLSALKSTHHNGVDLASASARQESSSKGTSIGGDAASAANSSRAASQRRLPSRPASRADHASTTADGEGSNAAAASLKVTLNSTSPSPPLESEATPRTATAAASSVPSASASERAEDEGSPSPVMSTTPGPSSSSRPPSSTHRHPCFCEVDSGNGSSNGIGMWLHCFQAATRWGTAQRIVCCGVREDHLYEDVQRGVLASFGDYVGSSTAPSLTLTMELVRIRGSACESLPLTKTTLLKDIPAAMCVESTELCVSSPILPAKLSAPLGESPKDAAAPADDALLRFIASAIARQLASRSVPLAAEEVHTLMCSLLREKATAEPFKGFLSQLSTPSEHRQLLSQADLKRDGAAAAALLVCLQRMLSDLALSLPQTQTFLQELAASLLCADFCDDAYCLNSFFTGICAALGDEQQGPRPVALSSLFQRAAHTTTADGTPTEKRETSCASVVVPITPSEWKTAFDKAPSSVLDVIAAAHMYDLLKTSPSNENNKVALDDKVWREAFPKAQLQLCEMMAPAEMERYFKEGAVVGTAGEEQLCRSVLLSCIGALLAPAALTGDYGPWLVDHFCGRVGAVLYAKMSTFDGRTELSLPALVILSWTVLNPHLLALIKTSAHRTLLEKLVGWVRVAVAHACYVRGLSFPPYPLHRVHSSQPTPLTRELVRPPLDADGVSEGQEEYLSLLSTDADKKAPAKVPAALATPSPPTSPLPAVEQPAARKVPIKKVKYVYKYNFSSLHLPRSLAK
ncbi:hypothetical protein ABL78_5306 [Leptomonas seymouri]|uniref:Uncharacterized protein n=1 Tax=Leptomonas seymouri TaxID=5684 RepID=A0A0N1PB13_LEPSE|nr:hypothetical protein ABL78_5306 [Leptomonas seymouri]|eukprot:KPI85625.1 hypothetical protein ABL78_5306 [Leptomonas seymouri]